MTKILIIRFSSIGDIIQCMSVTQGIKNAIPDAEIHWVTRKDMAGMLKTDPDIDHLWEFNRKDGVKGLMKLAREIKKINPDIIYDAHLNIRSMISKWVLAPVYLRWIGKGPQLIVRKKNRFNRFLFFNLNMRKALDLPFKGMLSFQTPLEKFGFHKTSFFKKNYTFSEEVQNKVDAIFEQNELQDQFITLVPSAAWELKRWPVDYWSKLVSLMPERKFVILAGPDDTFTKEIEAAAPDRVINLAGKTNLLESFYAVFKSNFVISADTGFLHAADLFRKPSIALMGPTAFGHPTGSTVKVMEVDLPCRPCTKEGNAECKLAEVKKCLTDITPLLVKQQIDILERDFAGK